MTAHKQVQGGQRTFCRRSSQRFQVSISVCSPTGFVIICFIKMNMTKFNFTFGSRIFAKAFPTTSLSAKTNKSSQLSFLWQATDLRDHGRQSSVLAEKSSRRQKTVVNGWEIEGVIWSKKAIRCDSGTWAAHRPQIRAAPSRSPPTQITVHDANHPPNFQTLEHDKNKNSTTTRRTKQKKRTPVSVERGVKPCCNK